VDEALALSAARRPCGLFFDFDGVLAVIGDDPEAVAPAAGVLPQLTRLSPLADRMAIISARPVSFLQRHFGSVPGVTLYGMYGLESATGRTVRADPGAEKWIPTIEAVKRAAERELPGVLVEDKRLAVALHYRQRPADRDRVEAWARAAAAAHGLAEQRGRMVAELKPPVATDKGTVLAGEIAGLRCAWYFGDDVSDVRGFRALRARQEQDSAFLGVCVAVSNPETGGEVEREADYVVAGPADMPALLATAVRIFAAGGAGEPVTAGPTIT
jgi:trehalose 6-phosphate phosphatase